MHVFTRNIRLLLLNKRLCISKMICLHRKQIQQNLHILKTRLWVFFTLAVSLNKILWIDCTLTL